MGQILEATSVPNLMRKNLKKVENLMNQKEVKQL